MIPAIAWPDPATITVGPKGYRTPVGTLPRMTSVVKLLGTGTENLMNWGAGLERDSVVQAAAEVYAGDDPGGPQEFIEALLERLGPARKHQRELRAAAEIGTAIHQMIQWTLRRELGEDAGPEPALSDPAQWGFMAWQDWRAKQPWKPVRIEQPVYDAELGVAGTVDLFAEDPQRGLGIVDWKSSSGIYDTHHLQVRGYARGAVTLGVPVRWAEIVRIPKVIGETEVYSKPLGDMTYDYIQKKTGRRITGGRVVNWDELLECVRACSTLYRTFVAKEAA